MKRGTAVLAWSWLLVWVSTAAVARDRGFTGRTPVWEPGLLMMLWHPLGAGPCANSWCCAFCGCSMQHKHQQDRMQQHSCQGAAAPDTCCKTNQLQVGDRQDMPLSIPMPHTRLFSQSIAALPVSYARALLCEAREGTSPCHPGSSPFAFTTALSPPSTFNATNFCFLCSCPAAALSPPCIAPGSKHWSVQPYRHIQGQDITCTPGSTYCMACNMTVAAVARQCEAQEGCVAFVVDEATGCAYLKSAAGNTISGGSFVTYCDPSRSGDCAGKGADSQGGRVPFQLG